MQLICVACAVYGVRDASNVYFHPYSLVIYTIYQ